MLSVIKQMKSGQKIIKNVTTDKTHGTIKIQLNSQFNKKFYRISTTLSTIVTAIKLHNTEIDSIENITNVLPYVPLVHTKQMLNYLLLPTSDICNMLELINIGLYIDDKVKFQKQIKKVLIINDCDIIENILNSHIIYMEKCICDRNIKLIKTLFINKLININLSKMQRLMQQQNSDNTIDIEIITKAIQSVESIIQKKISIEHNATESVITFSTNHTK